MITLVPAGSKDPVVVEDTRFIAENLPGAARRILEDEGHEACIVHKTKAS